MASILKRFPQKVEVVTNPSPIQNFESICDPEGNFKLQAKDPVAPSMAADYSITEVALMSRGDVASPVRISSDIVDLDSRIIND